MKFDSNYVLFLKIDLDYILISSFSPSSSHPLGSLNWFKDCGFDWEVPSWLLKYNLIYKDLESLDLDDPILEAFGALNEQIKPTIIPIEHEIIGYNLNSGQVLHFKLTP